MAARPLVVGRRLVVGGATRIRDHLCNTCTGESEEFIQVTVRRGCSHSATRLRLIKKAKRSDSDDDATDEEDH